METLKITERFQNLVFTFGISFADKELPRPKGSVMAHDFLFPIVLSKIFLFGIAYLLQIAAGVGAR
jgi:hypothetical protein